MSGRTCRKIEREDVTRTGSHIPERDQRRIVRRLIRKRARGTAE